MCSKQYALRFLHRLIPASVVCNAGVSDIVFHARKLLPPVFDQTEHPYKASSCAQLLRTLLDSHLLSQYKIELNIINHSKIKKDEIIHALAECVPKERGHTVDLTHPDIVILLQVFKVFDERLMLVVLELTIDFLDLLWYKYCARL